MTCSEPGQVNVLRPGYSRDHPSVELKHIHVQLDAEQGSAVRGEVMPPPKAPPCITRPGCSTPYHTIPYHATPYHTVSYHTIPHQTIPCHASPYLTKPPCITRDSCPTQAALQGKSTALHSGYLKANDYCTSKVSLKSSIRANVYKSIQMHPTCVNSAILESEEGERGDRGQWHGVVYHA